jgi:hypothetical protein
MKRWAECAAFRKREQDGGLPVGSLGEIRKAGACFDELHGFLRFCTTSRGGSTVWVVSSNVQRRQIKANHCQKFGKEVCLSVFPLTKIRQAWRLLDDVFQGD